MSCAAVTTLMEIEFGTRKSARLPSCVPCHTLAAVAHERSRNTQPDHRPLPAKLADVVALHGPHRCATRDGIIAILHSNDERTEVLERIPNHVPDQPAPPVRPFRVIVWHLVNSLFGIISEPPELTVQFSTVFTALCSTGCKSNLAALGLNQPKRAFRGISLGKVFAVAIAAVILVACAHLLATNLRSHSQNEVYNDTATNRPPK